MGICSLTEKKNLLRIKQRGSITWWQLHGWNCMYLGTRTHSRFALIYSLPDLYASNPLVVCHLLHLGHSYEETFSAVLSRDIFLFHHDRGLRHTGVAADMTCKTTRNSQSSRKFSLTKPPKTIARAEKLGAAQTSQCIGRMQYFYVLHHSKHRYPA